MTITMLQRPGPSGSADPGLTAEPADPAGFPAAYPRYRSVADGPGGAHSVQVLAYADGTLEHHRSSPAAG